MKDTGMLIKALEDALKGMDKDDIPEGTQTVVLSATLTRLIIDCMKELKRRSDLVEELKVDVSLFMDVLMDIEEKKIKALYVCGKVRDFKAEE